MADEKPTNADAKSGERRNKEQRLLEKLGKLALSAAAGKDQDNEAQGETCVTTFTTDRAKSSSNRSGRHLSRSKQRKNMFEGAKVNAHAQANP